MHLNSRAVVRVPYGHESFAPAKTTDSTHRPPDHLAELELYTTVPVIVTRLCLDLCYILMILSHSHWHCTTTTTMNYNCDYCYLLLFLGTYYGPSAVLLLLFLR